MDSHASHGFTSFRAATALFRATSHHRVILIAVALFRAATAQFEAQFATLMVDTDIRHHQPGRQLTDVCTELKNSKLFSNELTRFLGQTILKSLETSFVAAKTSFDTSRCIAVLGWIWKHRVLLLLKICPYFQYKTKTLLGGPQVPHCMGFLCYCSVL